MQLLPPVQEGLSVIRPNDLSVPPRFIEVQSPGSKVRRPRHQSQPRTAGSEDSPRGTWSRGARAIYLHPHGLVRTGENHHQVLVVWVRPSLTAPLVTSKTPPRWSYHFCACHSGPPGLAQGLTLSYTQVHTGRNIYYTHTLLYPGPPPTHPANPCGDSVRDEHCQLNVRGGVVGGAPMEHL